MLTASPSVCSSLRRVLQRNRAKVCTYFIRGKCNRGAECPFRHEMPEGGELAHQNIRDRYYGNNDPVARKMLRRLGERPRLEPPEDTAITTLYVGNVERNWAEEDLRAVFSKHGDLTRVKLVPNKSCAFVTYATRDVRFPRPSPLRPVQEPASAQALCACSDVASFFARAYWTVAATAGRPALVPSAVPRGLTGTCRSCPRAHAAAALT